jgi:hypothetical protein
MNLNELIKKHLKSIKEQQEMPNYMFFSNLEQIKRQCELLLELDHHMIDEILTNGHDWADDHISSAKENIDQVFDFMMNETKGHRREQDDEPMKADTSYFSVNEAQVIDEAKHKATNAKLWAQCLAWARSRYKVCPSAYCNGAAAKRYKQKGGSWKTVKK